SSHVGCLVRQRVFVNCALLLPSCPVRGTRQERQPHLTVGIVDVQVNDGDRLPRPQGEFPGNHGDRGVGGDQGWHHVGAAVAERPVLVSPAVVGGQQVPQAGEEVFVGTGP